MAKEQCAPPLPQDLESSLLKVAEELPGSVEAKKPKAADIVLVMLADGMSERAIERSTKISARTVRAMKGRHAEYLRVGREESCRRAARLAEKAGSVALQRLVLLDPEEATSKEDRLVREAALRKLNPRDMLTTYGIAVDKVGVLEASPAEPVKVEHEFTLEDASAFLNDLRAKSAEGQEADKAKMDRAIAEGVQRALEEREDAAAKVVELPGVRVANAQGS